MSRRFSLAVQIMVLGLLVGLSYAPSLNNPFEFDDWHVIPQNPSVRSLSDIPSFYTDPTTFSILEGNRDYRPLFLTSMAICWSLGDGDTTPFHLVSLILHWINAALALLILRFALTAAARRPAGVGENGARWTAFLAAVLFAVHPLASQSVVYISSQSVPLTAVFYLSAFLLYIRTYSTGGGGESPGRLWLGRAASVVCFFLALLSKPIAITLPINLVLWELICGDHALGRGSSRARGILSHAFVWFRRLLPYAMTALLYIYIRGVVLPNAVGPSETVRPRLIHYMTETKALVFYYLKLALAPIGQNIDPEFPEVRSLTDPALLVAVAVLLAVAATLWFVRSRREIVFWTLWFPVCLIVTTYATVLGQIVNEHRVYLSLIGFVTVVSLVAVRSVRPLGRRGGQVLVVASLVVVSVLSSATMERSRVWSSGVSLWGDAASNGGTWRAHMNYALALEDVGRTEEALFEFQEAVRLGPYAWAHINLGHAYVRRGRVEEGLPHLRQAVQLWPDLAEAHLFLGYGLDQAGNTAEAEEEMKMAISLRENYVKGHQFLAEFYERHGRTAEARQTYEELLAIDPHQTWAAQRLRSLATASPDPVALLNSAQYDEARRLLEASYAESPSPRSAELLFNLGFAYQRLQRREDAIRIYEELLEVAPRHRQGLFNLAYAYRDADAERNWERSASLFREVLLVDPGYDEAHHHLATVLRRLGRTDEADEEDRIYLSVGRSDELKARSSERLGRDSGQAPGP